MLSGLDDALLPYVHFFVNQRVDGYRLLLLASEDMEALHISKVGHQELILEAVQLLRHLHYELMSETLQSLFLQLSCKARNLYNELRMSNAAEVSTRTLSAVVDLLKTVKNLVAWMDRSPFEGCRDPFRQRVLQISVELALTAQRDKFADQPLAVIKSGVGLFTLSLPSSQHT
ncbi:CNKSR2 [Cordylochernes scorpioides]|uniref:CNKSR2 n=1 Tax=Cordylochernes scorpioides TaxID=51811 RepID=A0ABY6KQ29_9ARAC|nr:CNKSR2 [Cordylochernes scorpioides]UYV82451.1 CNKSR2 [Cordylochernes scorpioides]